MNKLFVSALFLGTLAFSIPTTEAIWNDWLTWMDMSYPGNPDIQSALENYNGQTLPWWIPPDIKSLNSLKQYALVIMKKSIDDADKTQVPALKPLEVMFDEVNHLVQEMMIEDDTDTLAAQIKQKVREMKAWECENLPDNDMQDIGFLINSDFVKDNHNGIIMALETPSADGTETTKWWAEEGCPNRGGNTNQGSPTGCPECTNITGWVAMYKRFADNDPNVSMPSKTVLLAANALYAQLTAAKAAAAAASEVAERSPTDANKNLLAQKDALVEGLELQLDTWASTNSISESMPALTSWIA